MLRCRFATGRRGRRHRRDGHPGRPRADRLGGAQPAAARQRPAERGLRGGRASATRRRRCSRRWCARSSSTSASSARWPSTTPRRTSTPTITAGCSTACREQAAAVIHNSIVFEQTQEDSLTDPLTGLPNTRFMFLHLSRELARAERMKSEVALLVMDLDDFKEINDTFGHHVGDRALREVARVLRAGIRPYDICVRYAGDEFVVVLAGCGADEAERKRRRAAARRRGSWCSRPGPDAASRFGISVGAAIFPHDGDGYEAIMATADSRMYRDKTRRKQRHRGANRRHGHRRHAGRGGDGARTDRRYHRRRHPARRLRRALSERHPLPIARPTCDAHDPPRPRRRPCHAPHAAPPARSRPAGLRLPARAGRHGGPARLAACASPTRSPRRRPRPIRNGSIDLLVQVDDAGGPDPHLELAAPGVGIDVEGPFGRFTLPPIRQGSSLLLVAGGTGIAPLRSMLARRARTPATPPRIGVVYSARSVDELAYRDELERAGRRRAHHAAADRDPGGVRRHGRDGAGASTEALLAEALPLTRCGAAWCAGRRPLVE